MADPLSFENVGLALPPGPARAALVAQAAELPDDKAEVLVECADATAYGRRVRLLRIGGGFALGAVVAGLGVHFLKL